MGGSVKGNRRDEDMKKILIIEDEPNIRELILYNLKTNGYDGIAAEDGIMGITMVHREKPDLISVSYTHLAPTTTPSAGESDTLSMISANS